MDRGNRDEKKEGTVWKIINSITDEETMVIWFHPLLFLSH